MLLCKTFLHTEVLMLVQIPNFSLYYNNGENTTGGGIAMYINNTFNHKGWLDLDEFEKWFFEYKLCEVAINKKWQIFIKKIYIHFQMQAKIFFRNLYTENRVC